MTKMAMVQSNEQMLMIGGCGGGERVMAMVVVDLCREFVVINRLIVMLCRKKLDPYALRGIRMRNSTGEVMAVMAVMAAVVVKAVWIRRKGRPSWKAGR